MDIVQLRQAIQELPEKAQTKPLLAALLENLASFSSSLATFQQRGALPEHPVGLCGESTCSTCVSHAQRIASETLAKAKDQYIAEGRAAALDDVQTFLTWGGGKDLADRITQMGELWTQQARPAPGSEPALTIVRG